MDPPWLRPSWGMLSSPLNPSSLILHILISFLQTQHLISLLSLSLTLLHLFSRDICSHLSFQCMAAAMIILTFVDEGRINSLWGLFAAGCLLGGAAILGFITGFTLRPAAKALVCLPLLTISLTISPLPSLTTLKHILISYQFFWALLGAWIASVAVMIVNGAMLNHYMNDRCNGKNAGLNCQDIREYHTIVYAAFGIPVALWVPTLIVGAYYLWRTSRLMRKEGAAPVAPVVPVGSSTM